MRPSCGLTLISWILRPVTMGGKKSNLKIFQHMFDLGSKPSRPKPAHRYPIMHVKIWIKENSLNIYYFIHML